MDRHDYIPYSRVGLEQLATALNIKSAYLWVNPARERVELRQTTVQSAEDQVRPNE